MRLIAHRGNMNGPRPEGENVPVSILKTLQAGFDVEVDVWLIGEDFFLGHDRPEHAVGLGLLDNDKVWCHAKSLSVLEGLLLLGVPHVFWHEDDKYTLTSCGKIWTYPGMRVGSLSILVEPSGLETNLKCYGVCSDYIAQYE